MRLHAYPGSLVRFGLTQLVLFLPLCLTVSITSEAIAELKAPPSVAGKIAGHDISLENALFRDSILYIHTGDSWSDNPGVILFLGSRIQKGVIPAKTSIHAAPQSIHGSNIHIHFRYPSENPRSPKADTAMRDYELNLKFDAEEDGFLPGFILLEIPGKEMRLQGRFRAEIKGLRLIDGHPDLRSDASETLEHAAKLYLERKLGEETVTILKGSEARWVNLPGKDSISWGSLDVEYRVGEQNPSSARLQLLKGKDGWAVHRELPLSQLVLAHPLSEGERSSDLFQHLAAVAIEQELNEKFPGKAIYWSPTNRGSGRVEKAGIGNWRVECRVEGVQEPIDRNYLFRREGEQWTIVGTLDLDQEIDRKTGEIVRRPRVGSP
jgi:hypothetical protein